MSQVRDALIGDAVGRRRRHFGLLVAIGVAVLLVSQAYALVDETSAQEVTCPGGATPQPDYGGQLVCPETGTITSGEIPSPDTPGLGLGLIVFGGGTSEQLVTAATASGCSRSSVRFWVLDNGRFITFIPGARVQAVNAAWLERFAGGIPSNTPMIATCRSTRLPTSAAPSPPAPSAARTVVVQSGDTLIAIGARAGIDWQAIAELNGVPGPDYVIYVGQTLVLPVRAR